MADEKNTQKQNNNIILENRRMLTISGVEDIDKFDESSIVMFTALGELTVKGKDLHINKVSVESGDLQVEGEIGALIYGSREHKNAASFLTKLFK